MIAEFDREEIIEFGADEEALFLAEDIYDKAIIGVCDGRVCYDEDKVITILMEYNGLTYEDALEFYEFNILGSYMGPLTPLFITAVGRVFDE